MAPDPEVHTPGAGDLPMTSQSGSLRPKLLPTMTRPCISSGVFLDAVTTKPGIDRSVIKFFFHTSWPVNRFNLVMLPEISVKYRNPPSTAGVDDMEPNPGVMVPVSGAVRNSHCRRKLPTLFLSIGPP